MARKKQTLFDPDIIQKHVLSVFNTVVEAQQVQGLDFQCHRLLETQSVALSKKYVHPGFKNPDHDLNAYLLFEQVNQRMGHVSNYPFPSNNQNWGLGRDQRVLLRAKNIIAATLGAFCEDEFFAHCKHSSGSTVGVKFSDTSPEAKFRTLTHTKGVEKWFHYYLQYDPQLKIALGDNYAAALREVNGNNATTVPKDSNKVRMICVEPTLNMFFQQGLMHCLVSRLERVGLSLEFQQDRNRELAWKASITGSHATIDWSSASDTLNYDLIQHLLPRRWFYYLDQFRCTEMNMLGGVEKLNMFSTMGNACTFPLETLVFWALACAVKTLPDSGSDLFDVSCSFSDILVFGDDCLVPTGMADTFIEVLQRFGFMPNIAKTFLEGRFRESCGGDYLAGQDVRPFFLTGPSDTKLPFLGPWLSVIFNRLQNRFIRIYGPLKYIYVFTPIVEVIVSYFRKFGIQIPIVPTYFPDDAGFKCGSDLFRYLRYVRLRDVLSPISVDSHGTKHFTSFSATYPGSRKKSDDVRYWMAIKGLTAGEGRSLTDHSVVRFGEASLSKYFVKRRQTYVVCKGASPVFCLNRDGRHG